MTLHQCAKVSLVIATSLVLSACGGGGGGGQATADGPRGIYTSTHDCSSAGLFELESCREAIGRAIKSHRANAPRYKRKRVCESKEISCERSFRDEFRPRLLAFLMQQGTKKEEGVVAIPLYPPNGTDKGFRGPDDKHYMPKDVSIEFSPMAEKVLAANLQGGKRKKKGMF